MFQKIVRQKRVWTKPQPSFLHSILVRANFLPEMLASIGPGDSELRSATQTFSFSFSSLSSETWLSAGLCRALEMGTYWRTYRDMANSTQVSPVFIDSEAGVEGALGGTLETCTVTEGRAGRHNRFQLQSPSPSSQSRSGHIHGWKRHCVGCSGCEEKGSV